MWYHAPNAQQTNVASPLEHFLRTLPICSRERRASPKVTHNVGTVISKKFGQAFQGLQVTVRVANHNRAPGRPPQRAKSPIPKISSARGSKMPAGILRRGRIARASPMGKGRSMRPFPINERGQHTRLTQSGGTTWGGTPLPIIDLLSHRLSGGQSCGGLACRILSGSHTTV